MRHVAAVSLANKRSLWGYKGDSVSPFIKITVVDTKQYPKVRNAFERGEVQFKDFFDGSSLLTFESNIAYTLRFMIDHHVRTRLILRSFLSLKVDPWRIRLQILGMNWLELKPGRWEMTKNKVSNCQYEIDCQ
jgi:DNA polymerase delta subunit 1